MSMMTNTLGRYFAGRFVVAAVGVFASIFLLLVLVDYIEMVRKTSIDGRTTRHKSYALSQRKRKMIELCSDGGSSTALCARQSTGEWPQLPPASSSI